MDTRDPRRYRRTRLAVTGVAALLAGTVALAQPPDRASFISVGPPAVALVHTRLVDGTGADAKPDHTVIIDGNRIRSVGPSASTEVPVGATVVDLSGHTLLPGFVQLHEHTYFGGVRRVTQMSVSGPRLYLAYGVTTAMTAGSQLPYHELNMQRSIEAGRLAGPRLHLAGPYLDRGFQLEFARNLDTPEEARRLVAYWAREGVTWFKFMGRVSREMLRAGIDEAHARGLRVSGHLCSVTFTEAAALGIDALHHGFLMNTDYVTGKRLDECPEEYLGDYAELDLNAPQVAASIRSIVASGAAVVSTHSVYETFDGDRGFVDPRALDMLDPVTRLEIERRYTDRDSWDFTLPKGLFARMLAWDRAFVDAGGLLGSGSDPWGTGLLPGIGNVRNYEIFIEAGFSPLEAIQIMTLNGARILGLAHEIGTIEVGKLADLVVIDGDPLTNPGDMYDVVTVFKDGIGYDAVKLRASVQGTVGLR